MDAWYRQPRLQLFIERFRLAFLVSLILELQSVKAGPPVPDGKSFLGNSEWHQPLS